MHRYNHSYVLYFFFFFNDTATTEIYTLSLHDALPILAIAESCTGGLIAQRLTSVPGSSKYFIEGLVTYSNASKTRLLGVDRKSTRLNSSHGYISYAVFCLKKKK